MSKDIRLTYIVDEVYKSLTQMCQMNGSDLSEVIRELAAKQQLVDIRSAISRRPVFDHEAGNVGPSEVHHAQES